MADFQVAAKVWWALFSTHTVECSIFILLVWAIDRTIRLDTRIRHAIWLLALAKLFVPPIVSAPIPVDVVVPSVVAAPFIAVGAIEAVGGASALTFSTIAMGLWLISVAAAAGVVAWQNARMSRRMRSAVSEQLAGRLGSESSSNLGDRVYSAADIRSPVLQGLIRPRLYLPDDWHTWPDTHLKGILSHEVAHVRRGDLYVLAGQILAIVLMGTNPLVWLVHTRLNHIREILCDQEAVRASGLDPVVYSRLLMGFLERSRQPLFTGISFVEHETSVFARFRSVLETRGADMKPKRWQLAIALLVGLAVVPSSCGVRQGSTNVSLSADKPAYDGIVDFFALDEAPEVVKRVDPKYPKEAREEGLQGSVFVQFIVDKEGLVEEAKVLRGPDEFREAALDAVRQWRYKPAMRNGEKVKVRVSMPMHFRLNSSSPPASETSP